MMKRLTVLLLVMSMLVSLFAGTAGAVNSVYDVSADTTPSVPSAGNTGSYGSVYDVSVDTTPSHGSVYVVEEDTESSVSDVYEIEADAEELLLLSSTPVEHTHADVTGDWYALPAAGGALSSGNYVLTETMQLTSTLTIAAGETVVICLNGKTLTAPANSRHISNSGTLTVCDCSESTGRGKLTGGNISGGGGAIYTGAGAKLTLNNVELSGNKGTGGGAVYVSKDAVDFTATKVTFKNNTATKGAGGAVYFQANKGKIEGSVLQGNTALNPENKTNGPGRGGALLAYTHIDVKDTVIEGNTADYGGGVYSSVSSTWEDTTITKNTSNKWGGGLALAGTATIGTGTVISENTAGTLGGGIRNAGTLKITAGTITANEAKGEGGGGIYSTSGTITMSGGTISSNKALAATAADQTKGSGAGIYMEKGTFNMTGGEISENRANATSYAGGGAGIRALAGTLNISGGSIKNNKVLTKSEGGVSSNGRGGGLLIGSTSSTAGAARTVLTVSGNAEITGNTAGSHGDGVQVLYTGDLKINGGTITGNAENDVYVFAETATKNVPTLAMTGGTVGKVSVQDTSANTNRAPAQAAISGGNVIKGFTREYATRTVDAVISITGGKFHTGSAIIDVSSYLPATGYAQLPNGVVIGGVVTDAASAKLALTASGKTFYFGAVTEEVFLQAADMSGTVKFLADHTFAESGEYLFTLGADVVSSLTVDLGGKKVTLTDSGFAKVQGSAEVTVKGGSIVRTGTTATVPVFQFGTGTDTASAKLTLENLEVHNSASVNIVKSELKNTAIVLNNSKLWGTAQTLISMAKAGTVSVSGTVLGCAANQYLVAFDAAASAGTLSVGDGTIAVTSDIVYLVTGVDPTYVGDVNAVYPNDTWTGSVAGQNVSGKAFNYTDYETASQNGGSPLNPKTVGSSTELVSALADADNKFVTLTANIELAADATVKDGVILLLGDKNLTVGSGVTLSVEGTLNATGTGTVSGTGKVVLMSTDAKIQSEAALTNVEVCEPGFVLDYTSEVYTMKFGGHTHAGITADWKPLPAEGGTIESGYYVLSKDLDLTSVLTVPAGTNVTICLNGHKLTRSSKVIDVRGGNLTICDCGTTERVGYIDASTGLWTEGAKPANVEGVVYPLTGGYIARTATSNNTAIYVASGSLTLDGVDMAGSYGGNTAGPAINCSGGTVTLKNSKVVGNKTTGNGGGISIGGTGTLTMENSVIAYNTASGDGGGIYFSGKEFTLTAGNSIEYNTAKNGGGITVYQSTVNVTGGTVTGNKATNYGGGFYLPLVKDGDTDISKGVLNITGTETAPVMITGNTAAGAGGALFHQSKTVSVEYAVMENNKTDGRGGAILAYRKINVANSTIQNNSAKEGGGVYASVESTWKNTTVTNNTATTYAGGLGLSGKSTLENVVVSNNTATTYAGGINYYDGTHAMTGVTISGNTAATIGGGVHVRAGTLTMTDCKVTGNTAAKDGYDSGGGGIFAAAGTLNIVGGEISGNKATAGNSRGGGILLGTPAKNAADKKATLNLSGDALITGNDSGSMGDGVYVMYNGVFNLNGGTITGNNQYDVYAFAETSTGTVANVNMSGGTVGIFQIQDTSAGSDRKPCVVNVTGGTVTGSFGRAYADRTVDAIITVTGGTFHNGSKVINVTSYLDTENYYQDTTSGKVLAVEENALVRIYDGETQVGSDRDLVRALRNYAGTGYTVKMFADYEDDSTTDYFATLSEYIVLDLNGYDIRIPNGKGIKIDESTGVTRIFSSAGMSTISTSGIAVNVRAGSSLLKNLEIAATTAQAIGVEDPAASHTIEDCVVYSAGWHAFSFNKKNVDLSGSQLTVVNSDLIVSISAGNPVGGQSGTGAPVLKIGEGTRFFGMNANYKNANIAIADGSVVMTQAPGGAVYTATVDDVAVSGLNMWALKETAADAAALSAVLSDESGRFVETSGDITLSDNTQVHGSTALIVNGTLTVADGKTLSVSGTVDATGGTINGSAVLTSTIAQISGPAGMDVTTNVRDCTVIYDNGVYSLGFNDSHAHGTVTDWNELLASGGALNDGNYVLIRDVKLTQPITVEAGKTVTICLNGYTLKAPTNNRAIMVKGTLTVCDCQTAHGKIGGGSASGTNAGGAIYVDAGANLTLKDIELSGNKAGGSGGAVYVKGSAAGFTADNVTVKDNKAGTEGGGIFIGTLVPNVTITDSVIDGNEAGTRAGGILAYTDLTLTNSTVSNNTAGTQGGGLRMSPPSGATVTLTMTGSTISGNTAEEYGGGIYVSGTAFTMTDGNTIEGNTATKAGGGLYIASGTTISMTGGKIKNNTAAAEIAGGVEVIGTFNMSGGEISGNKASVSAGGGVGIYGGTFNLSGGTITENTAFTSGGGVYIASSGTFNMTDGTISKNSVGSRSWNIGGGGVFVAAGTTFNLEGGTIEANTHTAKNTYGVKGIAILSLGNTYIKGGTITNHTNAPAGYAPVDGVVTTIDGLMEMTGGKITGNTVSQGTVFAWGDSATATFGTFVAKGGEISGNTASFGAGVLASGRAVVTASDDAKILNDICGRSYQTLTPAITITGGKFGSLKEHADGMTGMQTIMITGGTFNGTVKMENTFKYDKFASGYGIYGGTFRNATDNGITNVSTLLSAAFKQDNTGAVVPSSEESGTLEELLQKAIEAGSDTITLQNPVLLNGTEPIVIPAGMTLDTNGQNISGTATLKVEGSIIVSSGAISNTVDLTAAEAITISGGDFTGATLSLPASASDTINITGGSFNTSVSALLKNDPATGTYYQQGADHVIYKSSYLLNKTNDAILSITGTYNGAVKTWYFSSFYAFNETKESQIFDWVMENVTGYDHDNNVATDPIIEFRLLKNLLTANPLISSVTGESTATFFVKDTQAGDGIVFDLGGYALTMNDDAVLDVGGGLLALRGDRDVTIRNGRIYLFGGANTPVIGIGTTGATTTIEPEIVIEDMTIVARRSNRSVTYTGGPRILTSYMNGPKITINNSKLWCENGQPIRIGKHKTVDAAQTVLHLAGNTVVGSNAYTAIGNATDASSQVGTNALYKFDPTVMLIVPSGKVPYEPAANADSTIAVDSSNGINMMVNVGQQSSSTSIDHIGIGYRFGTIAPSSLQQYSNVKLLADATINGDLTVYAGTTLDLSEAKLTVTGKVYVNGTVINESNLIGTRETYVPATADPTYAVTVEKTAHGQIIPVQKYCAPGATVTLKAVPANGYMLYSVTATNSAGKAIAVKKVSDLSYSCKMVKGGITVTATFIADPTGSSYVDCYGGENCACNDFIDLDSNQWYHAAADYVLNGELMQGMGDGKFQPNASLSRAMLAQILYNLAGKPSERTTKSFKDVDSDAWYAEAVAWAAEKRIVTGYGDNTFRPNDNVTREQAAAMLHRYAKMDSFGKQEDNELDLTGYTDNQTISAWALEDMKWAIKAGVISGVTTDTLVPDGKATRIQTATMLMRFCEKAMK